MEKPAVGQRWRHSSGEEGTVTGVDDGGNVSSVALTDGSPRRWCIRDEYAHHFTFLGGPTPALGVPVVMGERAGCSNPIMPAACLFCGAETAVGYFACSPCIDATPFSVHESTWRAWNAGARDFPRPAPATPQPEAPPPDPWLAQAVKHMEKMAEIPPRAVMFECPKHGRRSAEPVGFKCPECLEDALIRAEHMRLFPPRIPASKPLPVHPRFAMEQQRNGVALTALDHIKARKPPEPWVPSVDDWDLLPDAGR